MSDTKACAPIDRAPHWSVYVVLAVAVIALYLNLPAVLGWLVVLFGVA